MENVIYKWVISQMECKPAEEGLTDVVVTIHWRRNAATTVQGKDYFADIYGSYSCPMPSGEDFTPYEDLTEEQVEGWLDAGLDVDAIDAGLVGQLENQINPPIITLPLPWDKPSEVVFEEAVLVESPAATEEE